MNSPIRPNLNFKYFYRDYISTNVNRPISYESHRKKHNNTHTCAITATQKKTIQTIYDKMMKCSFWPWITNAFGPIHESEYLRIWNQALYCCDLDIVNIHSGDFESSTGFFLPHLNVNVAFIYLWVFRLQMRAIARVTKCQWVWHELIQFRVFFTLGYYSLGFFSPTFIR